MKGVKLSPETTMQKVTKRIRDEYEALLKQIGEDGFYKHITTRAILVRKHYEFPENMMLEQSDGFFALFRTTGNENYFVIGKILRRTAHKLYREARKDPNYPINKKFIDLIK